MPLNNPIFMVDLTDGTLHNPRSIIFKDEKDWGRPITECGVMLDNVTMGAGQHIRRKIKRRCPDCFPGGT